jgi:hypothetical protein
MEPVKHIVKLWLAFVAVSLLTALPALTPGRTASAAAVQEAATVVDAGVENRFPDGMIFRAQAEGDAEIERVRLRYKVLPDGTNAIGEAKFEPGSVIDATFELEGNNPPKIYLPPGTVVEYYWEVTDENGVETTTETQTFFYDDNRFEWANVEGDDVVIYYYSGSEGDAAAMHEVAVEVLGEMSSLLGTEIPFEVQVWAYDSVEDMRPALARRSEAYESRVITAGVRVATNTVLVLGNVSFDTLRHELTHVVTAQAGESALGTMPAWLDEGTAVYGQEDPGGFGDAIENGIAEDDVFTVREITAYPGDPSKVGLFYGQGWSLVSYLVATYGEEKFAQVFAEIKGGKRIDSALEVVYGFDQDGLDAEWREANGLSPRVTEEPDEAEPQETGVPSVEDDAGDGDGTSTGVIVAVGIAMLVLAGAVAAGGIALARRV